MANKIDDKEFLKRFPKDEWTTARQTSVVYKKKLTSQGLSSKLASLASDKYGVLLSRMGDDRLKFKEYMMTNERYKEVKAGIKKFGSLKKFCNSELESSPAYAPMSKKWELFYMVMRA
jgi:hypothetical protein